MYGRQDMAEKRTLTAKMLLGIIGATTLVGGMAISACGALALAVVSMLEAESAALWAIFATFLAPGLFVTGKVAQLAYAAEREFPE